MIVATNGNNPEPRRGESFTRLVRICNPHLLNIEIKPLIKLLFLLFFFFLNHQKNIFTILFHEIPLPCKLLKVG